jgi:hypothetical protein
MATEHPQAEQIETKVIQGIEIVQKAVGEQLPNVE